MRTRLASLALMFVLAFALGGCGSKKPKPFESPYDREVPALLRTGTLDELYSVLKDRSPQNPVFIATGRIAIWQEGVDGTAWFDAHVLYRHPDAVRLRGTRNPLPTLFEVIVSGDRAFIHLTREKRLYAGSLAELRGQGGPLGALSLQDMMAAIEVNHDLRRRLEEGDSWSVLRQPDEIFLTQDGPAGRRVTWRIGRNDALVREIVIRNPSGDVELRALYEGYLLEGEDNDVPLPSVVWLYVEGDTIKARFKARDYQVRPDVDPANVDWLPNVPVYTLASMGADAPVKFTDEQVPRD